MIDGWHWSKRICVTQNIVAYHNLGSEESWYAYFETVFTPFSNGRQTISRHILSWHNNLMSLVSVAIHF